ncbi:MAG: hypothetical protein AB8B83_04825 [Bdellovibrionales bacterium]
MAKRKRDKDKARGFHGNQTVQKAPLSDLWANAAEHDGVQSGAAHEAGLTIDLIKGMVDASQPLPNKLRAPLTRRLNEASAAAAAQTSEAQDTFADSATNNRSNNAPEAPNPVEIALTWALADRMRTSEVARSLGMREGVFRKMVNRDDLEPHQIETVMDRISHMDESPIQKTTPAGQTFDSLA